MNTQINIHSSFIDGASYNEATECLRLEIHSMYYYYYGITKQKIARFKKAASKGRYFIKYIKGQYKMTKRKVRRAL